MGLRNMNVSIRMFPTIHWYESRITVVPQSVKNSCLGRGVSDNPLATCSLNLDGTKAWGLYWRTGTCLAISCPVKEWLIGVRASPAPATPLRKLVLLKAMFDHLPKEYCILWRVCQDCCYHISLSASLSPRSTYAWNGNTPDPKTSWSH